MLVVGRAEMSGKPPYRPTPSITTSSPRQRSLAATTTPSELLTTPAALRRPLAGNLRTPSSNNRPPPSIVSYFTPKTGATAEDAAAAAAPTTPLSQARRGLKRRLTDSLPEDEGEKSGSLRSPKREKVVSDASAANLSSSIQSLLRPGPAFTSPRKSPATPRLIASPLRQPLPTAASPLRLEALRRQPLEVLRSPTANLPNLVRDGAGALPLSRCNLSVGRSGRERQVDWLTSYCKQRKKEAPPLSATKAGRPKNKPVPKGKIK